MLWQSTVEVWTPTAEGPNLPLLATTYTIFPLSPRSLLLPLIELLSPSGQRGGTRGPSPPCISPASPTPHAPPHASPSKP